jgi:hypothetical protein
MLPLSSYSWLIPPSTFNSVLTMKATSGDDMLARGTSLAEG